MNKKLVLLNDDYPTSAGEFFIDDEMKVLENHFEEIYILKRKETGLALNRYIPSKLELITYDDNIKIFNKITSLRYLFSKIFIDELRTVKNKYDIKISFLIIKNHY